MPPENNDLVIMTPYNNKQITTSNKIKSVILCLLVTRKSPQPEFSAAVGTETRYGLHGPEIESRSRLYFPHPYRPALEPNQPLVQRVPALFSWIQSDRDVVNDHPPLSRAEVKKRVELYLYCPFGPSWPVLRRNEFFVVTHLTEGQFLKDRPT